MHGFVWMKMTNTEHLSLDNTSFCKFLILTLKTIQRRSIKPKYHLIRVVCTYFNPLSLLSISDISFFTFLAITLSFWCTASFSLFSKTSLWFSSGIIIFSSPSALTPHCNFSLSCFNPVRIWIVPYQSWVIPISH